VNGGTDALDNLVLVHPRCNKRLGCRLVENKHAMRERRRVKREPRSISSVLVKRTLVALVATFGLFIIAAVALRMLPDVEPRPVSATVIRIAPEPDGCQAEVKVTARSPRQ
jgi:hypothetical protein